MKLNLQYGTGVIVLPGAVYPDNLPPDASYLHVLIAVCAKPSLLDDVRTLYPAVAAECRLPEALVQNAISYWIGCGVISDAAQQTGQMQSASAGTQAPAAVSATAAVLQTPSAPNPSPEPEKPARPALPTYPTEEYSRILTEADGLRDAVDECSRIAGKLFSEHETRQLVALYDTYFPDCESLLLLFMYCKNILGKTAVSYVIRTGLGLYDDGIRTPAELEAHIGARERCRDAEYQIRRLLGLGERALTAKERDYINAWVNTYSMPMDVITRAYEITVKNIDKPRMSYIDKILSGWNENGIRTLDAVIAAEAEFEMKKTAGAKGGQENAAAGQPSASYDLDTFLALAMNRSFEDTE